MLYGGSSFLLKVSSLGSGLDHVMDAITECEQLVRCQGRLESSASWKLFFQKEVFTPWFNPNNDPISTELIFRQIINGVRDDEYKLHTVRDYSVSTMHAPMLNPGDGKIRGPTGAARVLHSFNLTGSQSTSLQNSCFGKRILDHRLYLAG